MIPLTPLNPLAAAGSRESGGSSGRTPCQEGVPSLDLNLTAKVAVVTGAGRGTGLATVRTLAAEGVRVVVAARTITADLKGTAPFASTLAVAQ
ncbi:hypothetical protein QF026_000194 [Streptomyces aurantiacus]|nr:hypothetical protein [Streptomyces aurantiacus]